MRITHLSSVPQRRLSRTALALAVAAGLAVPATASASVGSSGGLAWAPPTLGHPITLTVPDDGQLTHLSTDQDYHLVIRGTVHGTLHIDGGHHVVLPSGGDVDSGDGRCAYLQHSTGIVHIEGVRCVSKRASEGINVSEPKGSTVQLENIRVDRVNGSHGSNHADLLQVWAGPSVLRVDRFEGSTTYQGFFFQPTKFGVAPRQVDLRHVVLRDARSSSAYLLWQSGKFPIRTQDVTVVRNPDRPFPAQVMWPKNGSVWDQVVDGDAGTPSPLTGDPGSSYRSPRYASSRQMPTLAPASSTSTSTEDPTNGATPQTSSSSSSSTSTTEPTEEATVEPLPEATGSFTVTRARPTTTSGTATSEVTTFPTRHRSHDGD